MASPKLHERQVGIELLARCFRSGGEALIAGNGFAGREFAAAVAALDAGVARPAKVDEPDNGIRLAPLRERIESIMWSLKGTLALERHDARTLAELCERVLQRVFCLPTCIWGSTIV